MKRSFPLPAILSFFKKRKQRLLFFGGEGELEDADDEEDEAGLDDEDCGGLEGAPDDGEGAEADDEGEEVDELDGAFSGESHADETVGDVVMVADPERFFVEGADDDNRKGVKEGDGEDEEGQEDGESGEGLIQPEIGFKGADDSGEVSEEVAAGVPHKDGGGVMVVEPEAAADACCQDGKGGDEVLIAQGGDSCEKEHCNGDGADGKAVHIVEKVDGIHQEHEPENGDGDGEPGAGAKEAQLGFAETDGDDGDEELTGKFGAGFHGFDVVAQTEGDGEECAEQEESKLRADAADAAEVSLQNIFCDFRQFPAPRKEPAAGKADAPRGEHGSAAEECGGFAVLFMGFAFGAVHNVETLGKELENGRDPLSQTQCSAENEKIDR